MSDDDLRRMFEENDPSSEVTDADLDELLSTERLLERIHATTERRRMRHFTHGWRRAGIVTASAVIVLSGTAAAISLLNAPATNTVELTCFSAASLHSNASIVSLSDHPLQACDELMHWPAPPVKGGQSGALCVLSNGSLSSAHRREAWRVPDAGSRAI